MCFCFETPDLVELRRRGFVFVVDGFAASDQLEIFRAYGQGLGAPNGYFGKPIGDFKVDGDLVGPTRYGQIVRGKNGAHIIPANPNQY